MPTIAAEVKVLSYELFEHWRYTIKDLGAAPRLKSLCQCVDVSLAEQLILHCTGVQCKWKRINFGRHTLDCSSHFRSQNLPVIVEGSSWTSSIQKLTWLLLLRL